MAKNVDELGFEGIKAGHGKKPNQKLKPYLVQQFLMRYTDEDHVATAYDIIDFLEDCGIAAERRSIYRDIEDINKVMWLMENKPFAAFEDDDNETDGITIAVAEEALAQDQGDDEKTIVYQKHAEKKGFYARQRQYNSNHIRLLAECVYSAKFLSEGQADKLADLVCGFVSKHQAEKIRHNAFLTDRVKTSNKAVLNNISTINDAMSRKLDGEYHKPEKISFQYLKYSISDMSKQVERRQGAKYVVSPFKLLINDGNYYLLAFDDKAHDMRTYRVDRMKNVRFTGEPREGEEAFGKIDLKTYTKRVFSMFGGRAERVTIRFINPLLDAVVDRFGNDKSTVWYEKYDESHFTVTTQVEISDQFYGWVLGFGKKAKILGSETVVEEFKAYLDKVRELY